MIPLFKTHASIGKSILKIEDVVRLSEYSSLDEVYLVEDSMIGFPTALKLLKEKLRFGLRFDVCNADDPDVQNNASKSKLIAFANGDLGCKDIYKLHTKMNQENILYSSLKEYENIVIAVPFYDSFLFNNSMNFSNCVPELPDSTIFFLEDNNLPFDNLIKKKVVAYCNKYSYQFFNAKSIYYENRSDFEAFQTYKCICNRNPGKQASLSSPNLDHFGSKEFCFESWRTSEWITY